MALEQKHVSCVDNPDVKHKVIIVQLVNTPFLHPTPILGTAGGLFMAAPSGLIMNFVNYLLYMATQHQQNPRASPAAPSESSRGM